jgi:hypothetical protein
MFDFLLSMVSPDGVPDGVASGLDFHTAEFVFGLITGTIATLVIWGMVKYVKFIIKEFSNSQKSDE